jgi:hypothetical protein
MFYFIAHPKYLKEQMNIDLQHHKTIKSNEICIIADNNYKEDADPIFLKDKEAFSTYLPYIPELNNSDYFLCTPDDAIEIKN